jgi:hypothetical protein
VKKIARDIRMPKLRMEASFEPTTLDAEKRTVEIRWYAGATIPRYSLFDGPYTLSFSMDPKAVRLGRLSSGSAPLKAGHVGNDDLSAVLGVIEKAWLAKDGGRALVRFSAREDVEPVFRDVQDGILRNVSMEAFIHAMDDVTTKGAEATHYLATDWEPLAVALVSVGADPGAQALSEGSEASICKLNARRGASQEDSMRIEVRLLATGETVEIEEADFDATLHSKLSAEDGEGNDPPKKAAKSVLQADPKAAKRAVDDALEAKDALEAEIKRVAAAFGLDSVWARRHINLGTKIEQVLDLAAEERAKRAPKTLNDIGFGEDHDSQGYRRERMAEALAARATRKPIPEAARQYAHQTLVELAYETLSWRGEHRGLHPRVDASRIVELALTTSDYPNLLANAANKILMPEYEAANPTYRMLAERQDLPDFKTASILKAGDFPVPLQVAEESEIKLGSFSEAKDTFALATYGRRLLFSFQAIVNDDLGAFARIMRAVAVRLADFENSLWFTLLTSASGAGPTLGDTGALFNATAVTTAGGHANLTASGTAISVDSIGVGRAAMRKQVSLDGIKLNVLPRYLLCSPDKETLARQYTTVLGPNLVSSSQNPWAGTLEPISDANLTSANPWYLFADPARWPVSVYGYLSGQAGPNIVTRQGFEVLGTEMRVALHFGIAFVDHRGAYRNAGA